MVVTKRTGHTGITWPFTPEGARTAIDDIAATGYSGIEIFGFVIDRYPEGVSGLRNDLDRVGLELAAAYCSVSLVDPALRDADLESMRRWASQVAALGGDVVVVGPDQRKQDTYQTEDYTAISRTLNEIGHLCTDIGVQVCFHPHTGTPVERVDEITRVMDAIDPEVVFMAPDTGQIAKGGGDPVEVIRSYRQLIKHLHLKDYIGGESVVDWEGSEADRTGYLDYVPLGEGVVDMSAILAALDPEYTGWVMVELDGTDRAPHAPRDAAGISKKFLERLQIEQSDANSVDAGNA